MLTRYRVSLFLLLIGPVFSLQAMKTLQFSSTQIRTTLIELYTSEGCSSCPGADRFLSSLKKHPQLWSTIVPVAFHVDYWDSLGWKDDFAKPEYTQRQMQYKRHKLTSGVYTPGFMKNGKEWRRGIFKRSLKFPSTIAGKLSFSLEQNGAVKVRYSKKNKTLKLHLVLLSMNQKRKIMRGENSGKILKHDFVVLEKKTYRSKTPYWIFELPKLSSTHSKIDAIAIWVTEINSMIALQAAGSYY